MSFWEEVLAIFLGDIFASTLIVFLYVMIQWFLRATDVRVGYSWKWDGPNFYPSFYIRNFSGSRSYLLGNISYTRKQGKELLFIDNNSVWDKELKPGSINLIDAGTVRGITSLPECTETEVTIRLQNGRQFWLKGTGPGQLQIGRIQKAAFWLRAKCEKAAIPLE